MNWEQNLSRSRCHPQVARQGKCEAAAIGRTVDRGDNRLGKSPQLARQVGDPLLGAHARARPSGARSDRRRPQGGEVESRAKATPGPGEDQDANAVVRPHLIERTVKLLDQFERKGVQFLGPVERQDGDVGMGPLQIDVAHIAYPNEARIR